MKISSKYEKGQVPAGLEQFAVERDGFMWIGFEDDVALVTNSALAAKNGELLAEKQKVQAKYDALVSSSGQLATQLTALQNDIASGNNITAAELAIVKALKGIDTTSLDVKKVLADYPVVQQKLAALEGQAENGRIAKTMGWNPDVFNDLRPIIAKDLKFEVATVTVDDKLKEVVHVEYKDPHGVTVKKELGAYARETPAWARYVPFLPATTEKGQEWIAQTPASGETPTGPSSLQQHIADRNRVANAAGNALVPPTPVVPVLPVLAV